MACTDSGRACSMRGSGSILVSPLPIPVRGYFYYCYCCCWYYYYMVCWPVCMCTTCGLVPTEAWRGHQTPGTGVRLLGATLCVGNQAQVLLCKSSGSQWHLWLYHYRGLTILRSLPSPKSLNNKLSSPEGVSLFQNIQNKMFSPFYISLKLYVKAGQWGIRL